METKIDLITIPLKDKITREEMLENIKDNFGVASFEIEHDWYNIHSSHLLEKIDDVVEDGYLLMDLHFKPVRIQEDETIVFKVMARMTGEYVIGEEQLEETE